MKKRRSIIAMLLTLSMTASSVMTGGAAYAATEGSGGPQTDTVSDLSEEAGAQESEEGSETAACDTSVLEGRLEGDFLGKPGKSEKELRVDDIPDLEAYPDGAEPTDDWSYDCSAPRDHGLPSGEKADTTVMVYMIGSYCETDGYNGTIDLWSMMSGIEDAQYSGQDGAKIFDKPPVNLVVETGGCDEYCTISQNSGHIEYEAANINYLLSMKDSLDADVYERSKKQLMALSDKRNIKWYENQRWYMTADEIFPARNAVKSENVGIPMSVPEGSDYSVELADFIKTTKEQYPANKYVLVLWGPAGGMIDGYGCDERGGSNIDTPALLNTLDKVTSGAEDKEILDLVYYQGSLMSNYETAMAWAPYTKTMIASEDSVHSSLWDLEGFLCDLCLKKPSTLKYNDKVVEDELTRFVNKCAADKLPGTLSAIKLSSNDSLKQLKNSLATFGVFMSGVLEEDPFNAYSLISDARWETIEFDSNMSGIIDLAHFCSLLSEKYSDHDEDMEEQADDLSSCISDIVNVKSTDDYDSEDGFSVVNGLSSYFPYNLVGYNRYIGNTKQSGDFWQEYLEKYEPIADETGLKYTYLCAISEFLTVREMGRSYSDAYLIPDKKTLHSGVDRVIDILTDRYKVNGRSYLEKNRNVLTNKKVDGFKEKMDERQMTLDDMLIVDGSLYSLSIQAYKNADYLYMSNWFTTSRGGSFNLGRLPAVSSTKNFEDSKDKTRKQISLDYYPTDEWFHMAGQPLSVFYSDFEEFGENPFCGTGTVYFPARVGNDDILIVVDFYSDEMEGEVQGVYYYDYGTCLMGDFVPAGKINKDVWIKPIYNAYEYINGETFSEPHYVFPDELGFTFEMWEGCVYRSELPGYYPEFFPYNDGYGYVYVDYAAETNAFVDDIFGVKYLLGAQGKLGFSEISNIPVNESGSLGRPLYDILLDRVFVKINGPDDFLKEEGTIYFNVLPLNDFLSLSTLEQYYFERVPQEIFFPDKEDQTWEPGSYVVVAFCVTSDTAEIDAYDRSSNYSSDPWLMGISAGKVSETPTGEALIDRGYTSSVDHQLPPEIANLVGGAEEVPEGVTEIEEQLDHRGGTTFETVVVPDSMKEYNTPEESVDQAAVMRKTAATLQENLAKAMGGGDGKLPVIASAQDTVNMDVEVKKGKIGKTADISSYIVAGKENRVTINTGTVLNMGTAVFAVSQNGMDDKTFKKAKKMLKVKKGNSVLSPKALTKGGAYTLVLTSDNTTLFVDVVDLSISKDIKKSAKLSAAPVAKEEVSGNYALADDKGMAVGAKNPGVITIGTIPAVKTSADSARILSGVWRVGNTLISSHETGEVSVGKDLTVWAKVNEDGTISLARASGKGKGKVKLAYMLNGKTFNTAVSVPAGN